MGNHAHGEVTFGPRQNSTTGGAKDVGEAESLLVRVPGPNRRCSDGGGMNAFREPEDEGGVEKTDERGDAEDGGLLSSLGVGEAEELLGFTEEDFDPPAARVRFEDRSNSERRVEGEEDAVGHGTGVGGDDDDTQQARPGSPIPLRAEGLVADGRLAPVEGGLGRPPRRASVAG